jgi:DNA polymerase I-like protein with 3'-5' exonuclease and polymerase domains
MRLCVGDLEADGLLDTATTVWCGVFKDYDSGEVSKFYPGSHVDFIAAMLAHMDSYDAVSMHNGIGYDWPLLEKLHGYHYQGQKIDTLILSRLIFPKRQRPWGMKGKAGPHSVESWGYEFGIQKPEHEDWSQFSLDMLHRCTEDVEIQTEIHKHIERQKGWSRAKKLTLKLFEILQQQEEYGWLMDQEWMHKSVSMLTHWIRKIDEQVVPNLPLRLVKPKKTKGKYDYIKKPFLKSGAYSDVVERWYALHNIDRSACVVGPFSRVDYERVDLNSNDQTKEYLLAEGWIPEKWNYKKEKGRLVKDVNGQLIPTSPVLNGDDPFEGVDGMTGKLIAKRVQCRHRKSQIEGWFKKLRPDGRLSQIISGMAATGRLTHKQIVNVPGGDSFFGKWMRKCFTCREGFVIVGTDSAGCQNRMLAARVGNPTFTDILINGDKEKGTSIHQVNQRAIKEVAGYDVTYRNSKNLNYAFMFGARDPKLGSIIGRGNEAGARIRAAMLSVAPGFEDVIAGLVKEWRASAQSKINRWGRREYYNGYITGLDGRPVLIESEHMLLVYALQSDEAIMMQYALLFLYKWCTERGWIHGEHYGFVANVHDEFQAEVRDDLAAEFAEMAERSIATAGEYLKIQCPHVGEADIGRNWWETH